MTTFHAGYELLTAASLQQALPLAGSWLSRIN
jgi:hypothetical protein